MRTVRRRCLGAARLTVIAAAISLPLGGCATRGDGEAATQRFELAELHAIDVGGVFELQAQQSSDRLVELHGDANLLPMVELDVQGGVLRARTRSNTIPQLPLVLVVHTPDLREIELSGAASGEITGISGERFELSVSGAGAATIAGRIERFELDVSGASQVHAAKLVARDVEVEASGASSADVTANVSLDADASGASEIRWGGDATQVTRDASGASSVERR